MSSRPSPLIRPDALLYRLRPITVETHARCLTNAHRLYTSLKLIRNHFPNELEEMEPPLYLTDWPKGLGRLCALIQTHQWFPIHWQALDEAYAYFINTDEDPDGDYLAQFLDIIPVAYFGLGNDKIYEFPPMELLRALVIEVEVISSELLVAAEIYDALDGPDGRELRAIVKKNLRQIEKDPGRYPEPVRYLPELARWACGETKNPLLDKEFEPEAPAQFTWESDLARVRQLWRRAAPVERMLQRLMTWYENDPNNLTKLTSFLTQEGGYPYELDW